MISEEDVEKIADELKKRFGESDREYVGFEWFYPYHLSVVREEAEELLDKFKDVDGSLVEAGALLHDVGYLKDHTRHEEVGFEVAMDLMDDLGIEISHEEKERLQEIISEHGYSGEPEIIEAKIVAAADALAHLRPEFVMAKTRVETENGKNLEDIEKWFRQKWKKDMKKAKILSEASRKTAERSQTYGDFIGAE